MQEITDEALLAAIAAGPGALPEFYERHMGKIVCMGVRRFDNPEDVADFVANVFLEVMTSAGGFDPARGRAVPWLYGLATNVAAGMRRDRFRQMQAAHQIQGREFLDADAHAEVEERVDAAVQARRAYAAMQRLSPADRRALELVAVDGLSTGEAANALGVSPVALRVRLVRARSRLRALMATEKPFPATSLVTKEEAA